MLLKGVLRHALFLLAMHTLPPGAKTSSALTKANLRPRLLATLIHLTISVIIIACIAAIIFAVWFPGAYADFAGGVRLFWLIAGVDMVLGPLLTLVVFNLKKPRAELVRDLMIIALIQVAALTYGLTVLYQARPIALVFEVDRFRVVSAAEVLDTEFDNHPEAKKLVSLSGPSVVGTRAARDSDERVAAIDFALQGWDVGQRPSFWVPYQNIMPQALSVAKPIRTLIEKRSADSETIRLQLNSLGLEESSARFLPLASRKRDGAAILDASGRVVAVLPIDGFVD
jgi:hypothetical protein